MTPKTPLLVRANAPRATVSLAVLLLAGTALAGMPLSGARAQQWTGAVSNDWNTAGNWSSNTVPIANVTIDTTTPNPTVLSGTGNPDGLEIGHTSTGALTVQAGGSLQGSGELVLGGGVGASGLLTVTGAGSNVATTGAVTVGKFGAGIVLLQNGGRLEAQTAVIGVQGNGAVIVDGTNSLWTSTGDVTLGDGDGQTTLNIQNGGGFVAGRLFVGEGDGPATVDITGAGSLLTSQLFVAAGHNLVTVEHGGSANLSGLLVVGGYNGNSSQPGTGTLLISTGGAVSGADSADIGTDNPGLTGQVTVDGSGSSFQVTNVVNVGNGGGTGGLTVQNGAGAFADSLVISATSGSSGTVTVSGANSVISVQTLSVAAGDAGSLSIISGGALDDANATVGAGGAGTVLVDGAHSTWNNSSNLVVGDVGASVLTISNGGLVQTGGTSEIGIGSQPSDSGKVVVTDATSQWTTTGDLDVGYLVKGELDVLNGAQVTSATGNVGTLVNAQGSATVDGAGSVWATNLLNVGALGNGSLTVSNGGAVHAPFVKVGLQVGSTGMVTVEDANSHLTGTDLEVGVRGTGYLTIANGGQVQGQEGSISGVAGSSGIATVTGAGSNWTVSDQLLVGVQGAGVLEIEAGATVDGDTTDFGEAAGSNGAGIITGAGSSLLATTSLTVGDDGTGTLDVKQGGHLISNGVSFIGNGATGNGTVTVEDANSTWANQDLLVGQGGLGVVNIQGGGVVTASDNVSVGEQTGATGQINIDGAGSALQVSNSFVLGDGADGSLFITHGGTATAASAYLANGNGTSGAASVDGAGSTLVVANGLEVGDGGSGALTITNGGAVHSSSITAGDNPNAFGDILVTGLGSSLTTDSIIDGFHGGASLTVANGAQLTAPNGITIASAVGSNGTLNIGDNNGSAPFAPGDVITPTVTFGAGDGALNFNHTSNHYTFSANISGLGEIQQLSGTTFLTGDSHGFTGQTNVIGGTLFVNGALGSNVTVTTGGSIGGTGLIGGLLDVAAGGHLIGSQGSILTVNALTLDAGAVFDANLTSPGGLTLVSVTHDLTLDGSVNIATGTAGPGVYRLIDYGGALTDNGLDIGTTPGGTTASDFAVQTSVAGQVNLVDTAALPLSFWDGGAAGHAGNGVIDGGDGVWSNTATNWTDINGTGTGAMTPQPGFAVFQGAPGTVTIDGSAGAVVSAGMQFAASGYTLTGDAISLAAGQQVFRVGDGSQAGAGYQATIASSLTGGSGGVMKTDLGTLILTGANTYTGGTTILDGTLQLGAGGASGSIVGDVGNSGSLAFDRSDTMTFTGAISGTGVVNQIGGGTTTLTALNTYTGATTISSGTLALSGSGSIAASSNVVDNGGLDISGASGGSASISSLSGSGAVTLGANKLVITGEIAPTTSNPTSATFSGGMSGAGGLSVTGGGLNLTGTNTYTGGTTIAAGSAIGVGVGGTTGSIVGDVADNGAFGILRSDNLIFSGAISGTGIFDQGGTGATTLTGQNTYTGGTLIEAGTLVGSASSFGTGQIGIASGGLVIDQATDASFANAINGFGTFTKRGAGALNLTGTNGLTGATTVAAGRLAINGSLAGSVITVQSGATLGGNGTVGGVIAQGGANIAPGNSIGTLQVAGNYSQASGSTYQLELTTTGQNDRINITGTANLASGAVLNVTKTDAGAYVGGSHYTVLTAAGGVTGTYVVTGDTQVTAFGGLVAAYDADDVYLVVAKNKTFAQAGLTHNQIGTGSGLDGLATSTDLSIAIANSATMATARTAFDQLSGEVHASAQTALIDDGRLLRDAVTGRLRSATEGVGSDAGPEAGGWGQVFGSWGDTQGDGNAAKLNQSTGGLFVGGDAPLDSLWRAGAVAGYSRTTFSVSGRQSAGDSDNYDLGVYAGAQQGPIGFRAGATYTWHDIDIARSVAIPGFSDHLTAKYRSGSTQVFVDFGYRLDLGQTSFGQALVEPFVDAANVTYRSGGFQEKGGTAALIGASGAINAPVTTLGLRASSRFKIGGATVTLRGSAGWRHAYDDVTPDSKVAFTAGGPTFDIEGAPIARDAAALDLGADIVTAPNLKLGLSYTGQQAGKAQDNGVKASLNWKF
jgi:fibronectin-binding autotransporter adhesin